MAHPHLAAVRDAGDVRRVCPKDLAISLTIPSTSLLRADAGYGRCEDCDEWIPAPEQDDDEVTLYLALADGTGHDLITTRAAARALVASTAYLNGARVVSHAATNADGEEINL